ncbi:MAG: hypothetical protein KDJ99_28755 [Candidatus Competibacteraceae bacterium]|nr:hypothetical protein [Candidatus Competibacteraceae bacterium]
MKNKILDQHGQPQIRQFNQSRLSDRNIDELIGLCKGILADGLVVQQEAEFLQRWLNANRDIADQWPANILYQRINHVLRDGHLDDQESHELLKTLLDITGGPSQDAHIELPMATTLPLDNPQPDLIFPDRSFCVTGRFAFGDRASVVKEITDRSGLISNGITKSVDYLLIGSVGSTDWIHTSYGRKIEKAVEYKNSQNPTLAIICEEHWVKFLQPSGVTE